MQAKQLQGFSKFRTSSAILSSCAVSGVLAFHHWEILSLTSLSFLCLIRSRITFSFQSYSRTPEASSSAISRQVSCFLRCAAPSRCSTSAVISSAVMRRAMVETVMMQSSVISFSLRLSRGGISTRFRRKERWMISPCRKISFFFTTYGVRSAIGSSCSTRSRQISSGYSLSESWTTTYWSAASPSSDCGRSRTKRMSSRSNLQKQLLKRQMVMLARILRTIWLQMRSLVDSTFSSSSRAFFMSSVSSTISSSSSLYPTYSFSRYSFFCCTSSACDSCTHSPITFRFTACTKHSVIMLTTASEISSPPSLIPFSSISVASLAAPRANRPCEIMQVLSSSKCRKRGAPLSVRSLCSRILQLRSAVTKLEVKMPQKPMRAKSKFSLLHSPRYSRKGRCSSSVGLRIISSQLMQKESRISSGSPARNCAVMLAQTCRTRSPPMRKALRKKRLQKLRGEAWQRSRTPMNSGVLEGLQSQMKCISLCALEEIDLKSSSFTTVASACSSVCFRSGSRLQFRRNLSRPSSSCKTASRTRSLAIVGLFSLAARCSQEQRVSSLLGQKFSSLFSHLRSSQEAGSPPRYLQQRKSFQERRTGVLGSVRVVRLWQLKRLSRWNSPVLLMSKISSESSWHSRNSSAIRSPISACSSDRLFEYSSSISRYTPKSFSSPGIPSSIFLIRQLTARSSCFCRSTSCQNEHDRVRRRPRPIATISRNSTSLRSSSSMMRARLGVSLTLTISKSAISGLFWLRRFQYLLREQSLGSERQRGSKLKTSMTQTISQRSVLSVFLGSTLQSATSSKTVLRMNSSRMQQLSLKTFSSRLMPTISDRTATPSRSFRPGSSSARQRARQPSGFAALRWQRQMATNSRWYWWTSTQGGKQECRLGSQAGLRPRMKLLSRQRGLLRCAVGARMRWNSRRTMWTRYASLTMRKGERSSSFLRCSCGQQQGEIFSLVATMAAVQDTSSWLSRQKKLKIFVKASSAMRSKCPSSCSTHSRYWQLRRRSPAQRSSMKKSPMFSRPEQKGTLSMRAERTVYWRESARQMILRSSESSGSVTSGISTQSTSFRFRLRMRIMSPCWLFSRKDSKSASVATSFSFARSSSPYASRRYFSTPSKYFSQISSMSAFTSGVAWIQSSESVRQSALAGLVKLELGRCGLQRQRMTLQMMSRAISRQFCSSHSTRSRLTTRSIWRQCLRTLLGWYWKMHCSSEVNHLSACSLRACRLPSTATTHSHSRSPSPSFRSAGSSESSSLRMCLKTASAKEGSMKVSAMLIISQASSCSGIWLTRRQVKRCAKAESCFWSSRSRKGKKMLARSMYSSAWSPSDPSSPIDIGSRLPSTIASESSTSDCTCGSSICCSLRQRKERKTSSMMSRLSGTPSFSTEASRLAQLVRQLERCSCRSVMMYSCRKRMVIFAPCSEISVGSSRDATASTACIDGSRNRSGLYMHSSAMIFEGLHSSASSRQTIFGITYSHRESKNCSTLSSTSRSLSLCSWRSSSTSSLCSMKSPRSPRQRRRQARTKALMKVRRSLRQSGGLMWSSEVMTMLKRRWTQARMKTCCGWESGRRRQARARATDLRAGWTWRKGSEAVSFLTASSLSPSMSVVKALMTSCIMVWQQAEQSRRGNFLTSSLRMKNQKESRSQRLLSENSSPRRRLAAASDRIERRKTTRYRMSLQSMESVSASSTTSSPNREKKSVNFDSSSTTASEFRSVPSTPSSAQLCSSSMSLRLEMRKLSVILI